MCVLEFLLERGNNPLEGENNPLKGENNPLKGENNPLEGENNPWLEEASCSLILLYTLAAS